MADTKISALAGVTSPATSDVVPIVNDSTTKKIDLNTLFTKIPGDLKYAGVSGLTSIPETVSVAGALSITNPVSLVTNASDCPITVTLANGSYGQEKTILCLATTSNVVVDVTQKLGFATITFTAAGQTVTLKYINTTWVVISNFGATIV